MKEKSEQQRLEQAINELFKMMAKELKEPIEAVKDPKTYYNNLLNLSDEQFTKKVLTIAIKTNSVINILLASIYIGKQEDKDTGENYIKACNKIINYLDNKIELKDITKL